MKAWMALSKSVEDKNIKADGNTAEWREEGVCWGEGVPNFVCGPSLTVFELVSIKIIAH